MRWTKVALHSVIAPALIMELNILRSKNPQLLQDCVSRIKCVIFSLSQAYMNKQFDFNFYKPVSGHFVNGKLG